MKSKAEFINKLNNMAEEAKADKVEMEKPEIPTNPPDRMDRDWIIQEFHLKDNEFLADKPELKEQLIEVLQRHQTAFAGGGRTDRAGKTEWVTARVELKDPETNPISARQRPLHPTDKALLLEQIEVWRQQDIIEPSDSAWSSAIMGVAKKNTKKLRFVLDLRALNDKCKR